MTLAVLLCVYMHYPHIIATPKCSRLVKLTIFFASDTVLFFICATNFLSFPRKNLFSCKICFCLFVKLGSFVSFWNLKILFNFLSFQNRTFHLVHIYKRHLFHSSRWILLYSKGVKWLFELKMLLSYDLACRDCKLILLKTVGSFCHLS